MFVHSEVTYGFNMPDEYDELKRFEADTDLSDERSRVMVTDITYCDWLCQFEDCERNAYQLEALVKENNKEVLQQVSWGKFEDCPHYGSTEGMYIPM